VVLVDDIITTGSTLAAVSDRLKSMGIDVAFCAVLAATRRWSVHPDIDLTRAMGEPVRNGFDDGGDAEANKS
jgi:adenine/guanine phosphoribosyltransferase-like PRPP-binding protein